MSKFMDTKAWRDNDHIRTEGSAAIVDAAIAAGVGRVVQESVSMLYPDRGAEWIDEDVPTDCYPMARGNLAAESNAKRFSDAGGTGVVLRFGWFYGPGAAHSEQFLVFARRHICVQMGRPDGYVSSIHVVDGGAAVAAALQAPGLGDHGKVVIVEHVGRYSTVYALQDSLRVSKGEFVEKGERIGSVGTSGNASGPHLPFEVSRDGEPDDPLPYLP